MAMPSLSFTPATSFSLSPPRRLTPLVVPCSSRAGNARVSRKAMSDADLCKELREFVSSVGFIQDHVPSITELTENGRKDLANIVRRRGYKAVRHLLANSVSLTEEKNLPHRFADDVTDDTGHNLWINTGTREYKENSAVFDTGIHDHRHSIVTRDKMENFVLNGTTVMSTEIANPISRRNNIRNVTDTSLNHPVGSDFGEMENQDEVQHLKNILQQKELELCQLRELFEKEKQALSTLQSKAEEEIKNAQKLISEMELELLAAEESLAGLIEVEIEYMEEAETVDLAGSFNGWYQPIKMDPHPDTGITPIKSRNPRTWHLSMWLYPGEYEVKFIVDGEWKVDPTREISTSNGLQNNILRVEG